MAEKSIVFDLYRTPNFVDNMNRSGCFDVNHMDGSTKRYEFVLASNCGDNIEDNLNNDVFLKGLFLRDRTTGYVLAYSIFDTSFPITNNMIIPKDRILWTIKNESD